MAAKITIKCTTPKDGSDFGCSVKAPHHGIGPNGIEGEDDETWEKNLAFSDRIIKEVYAGFHSLTGPIPEGGLHVAMEIDSGRVNFNRIKEQVAQAISSYLSQIKK